MTKKNKKYRLLNPFKAEVVAIREEHKQKVLDATSEINELQERKKTIDEQIKALKTIVETPENLITAKYEEQFSVFSNMLDALVGDLYTRLMSANDVALITPQYYKRIINQFKEKNHQLISFLNGASSTNKSQFTLVFNLPPKHQTLWLTPFFWCSNDNVYSLTRDVQLAVFRRNTPLHLNEHNYFKQFQERNTDNALLYQLSNVIINETFDQIANYDPMLTTVINQYLYEPISSYVWVIFNTKKIN